MGESLGADSGSEIGSSDGGLDDNGVINIEGSPLGDSLGADGGADID